MVFLHSRVNQPLQSPINELQFEQLPAGEKRQNGVHQIVIRSAHVPLFLLLDHLFLPQ
jgi:hypothetical protein